MTMPTPENTLMGLADRVGINTMVELLNSTDPALKLDAHRKDYYYDTMMLEKMKIGQENYVFLKYAKKFSMPPGHSEWLIRRSFPLTEHTVPLLEGIPPRSDKTRKDMLTGTYHQYARYMEFSDRVEWKLMDPIISEYAFEYGDVAVRTMHRLARKELLASTFKSYANNRSNIGELQIGDVTSISQLRLAILKMARLLVRPLGGSYPFITSEEHYWDLMKDPLIIEFLGANNGMSHYKTGDLPELFNVRFEKTMMDEFTFGYELGNAGEWADYLGNIYCRAYALVGNKYVYFNIPASKGRKTYVAAEYRALSGYLTSSSRSVEEGLPEYKADTAGIENADEANNRLSDGSWIPVRVRWNLAFANAYGADMGSAIAAADQAVKTAWGDAGLYYTYVHSTTTFTLYASYLDSDNARQFVSLGTVVSAGRVLTKAIVDAAVVAETITAPTIKQLPVHVGFLLGEEALGQLEVTGQGNVQVFAKQKGSAGVLDPVDQRQSIGFKINTLGFKLIKDEACWLFYHVPTQALATAGISL
jgi:hypothetical protein